MHNISLISSKKSRQFSAALSAAQSFAEKHPSAFPAKTLRDGVPSLALRSPSCPGTTHVASAHFLTSEVPGNLIGYLGLKQGMKI
ncbi:MAG: hypothetical protein GW748_05265 [Alphaproteobacteria bacterium]|nr:hypothetical protein [Alphaproteobacteria bacterium]NCQ67136.1 hypothetical protein [Alphaproteobacteria bacterium]NCT07732.1 hypothetical protein [Alphaproteobacteria bacterium]